MKYILILTFILFSTVLHAQNQLTWNPSINLSVKSIGNMHPRIAINGSGNPMVIWGNMSDQSLYFTKSDGNSFSTPIQLSPKDFQVATASWMGPDIASKGDTVYVVFKRAPENSDTSYIYIVSSFDGGNSFSKPVRVDYIADSVSRFPTVSVNESGNPVVAFMKFNSSFMQSRWVVTYSTDYGKTFSTDVLASGFSGVASEACDCCPGALLLSGSTSVMLYRDNLNNIRDIWAGISKDNHTTFKNGFAIDNTQWMINTCPSSGPDGVIIEDTIYSVFLSAASGNSRTYLSKTSLNNGVLSSVKRLKENFTELSQQNYPRIASYGKAASIVWKQTTTKGTQLPILFTQDITQGFPTVYDTVDLKDITNTDIAMSRDKIFVVWEDDNLGIVSFRSTQYQQNINNVSNVIQPNRFKVSPNPVNDFILIESPDISHYTVNIYSIEGLLVDTKVLNSKSTIDLSNVNSGIYIVNILSKDYYQSLKIIKQ